jgi:signal transduction histidine kinase
MPRHPITFTPEPDLPSVPGDPFRLSQVVRNLISYAIKYSPEGGPVAIKARHAGARVEISVRDRGVGIPPEQQPHVYEKFYRIEAPNTAIPGTGLGLSIARLITEAHGGTIQLESQVGVGSTFTVSLPTSRHEVPAGEEDVEAGA